MPRESTIQVFRSSTPGAVPTGLTQGELAVNLADAKIFVGSTTGQSIDIIGRTCVTSVNGATGAITSIAVTGANTFTGLQTMNAGITSSTLYVSSGATFAGQVTVTTFKADTVGGNEGGQIDFGLAATGTSLSTGVSIDIYQNRLRFFESGGTNRGAYIDLSAASAGVGSNLLGGGSSSPPLASSSVTGVASFGNEFVVSALGAVSLTANYVKSVNGSTGAISSIAVTGANTFTGLQTMNAGITSSTLFVSGGATFSGSNLVAFTAGLTAVDIRVTNALVCNSIDSYLGASLSLNNSAGSITRIGDVDANGGSTYLRVDDTAPTIDLNCPQGTITIGDDGGFNGTSIQVNDGSGSITLNGGVSTNQSVSVGGELSINNHALYMDAQYSPLTTTASNQTIWNRVIGDVTLIPFEPSFRSVELFIQASRGTTFECQKMIVLHDNTNTWNTTYGTVRNDISLASYNTTIVTVGNDKILRLRATPGLTGTSFRVSSTILPA